MRFSVIVLLAVSCIPAVYGSTDKLTDDDRIEILRGLMAEDATVKTYLPRSKKPLPFNSNGTWDKKEWQVMGRELGPAARVGDQVRVTKVAIERERIVLEINNGFKKGGRWYDHVQVGMGGGTAPMGQPTNAPGGTYIALEFESAIPPLKAADIKKMLTPVLDFDKHTVTENYVEKLAPEVQAAIKANKALVGMDRDEVLLALGKPRQKERSTSTSGAEMEDWIYGQPPGKIIFVTFNGSKVSEVKESYADIGGTTAMPLPPR